MLALDKSSEPELANRFAPIYAKLLGLGVVKHVAPTPLPLAIAIGEAAGITDSPPAIGK